MKTRMIFDASMELTLCLNTTDKHRELHQWINKSGEMLKIVVIGTNQAFYIPPNGRFYFDCCEGEFVQTFLMVSCSDNSALVRTGTHCYQMTEEWTKWWEEDYDPICDGWLSLEHDGRVLAGGYRLVCSEKGNPIIYVKDNVGIDSSGFMVLPEKHQYPYQTDQNIISGVAWGELCITSDRKILCRGMRTLEKGDLAINIADCYVGYLVQTRYGDVYFSANGSDWQLVGGNATAIAAWEKYIVWADSKGDICVCEEGKNKLRCITVLHFPSKYIQEIDISEKLAVIKFQNGTFDVVNWNTGKTEIGKRFVDPSIFLDLT